MTNYIVLAHTPKDGAELAFKGEFGYFPCEWVIFTGVHAKAQAEAKAKRFSEAFVEVQIREVGEIILPNS